MVGEVNLDWVNLGWGEFSLVNLGCGELMRGLVILVARAW